MDKQQGFVTLYAREDQLEKDRITGEIIGLKIKETLYSVQSLRCEESVVLFEEKNPHAVNFEGDVSNHRFETDDKNVFLSNNGDEANEKIDKLTNKLNKMFIKVVKSPYVVITDLATTIVNRKKGTVEAEMSFVQVPIEHGRIFFTTSAKNLISEETYTMEDVLVKEEEHGISS